MGRTLHIWEADKKRFYKDTLLAAGLSLLIAIGISAAYVLPVYALPVAAGLDQYQLETEMRAVYGEFMDAQNARDLGRVGSFFIDGPGFLWVSDGRSVWGREAALNGMGSFQKAAVWTVHPELEVAHIIRLGPETAMIHFPLVLEIGQEANPNRLGFLVSALFVRRGEDWRIASLLATGRKSLQFQRISQNDPIWKVRHRYRIIKRHWSWNCRGARKGRPQRHDEWH